MASAAFGLCVSRCASSINLSLIVLIFKLGSAGTEMTVKHAAMALVHFPPLPIALDHITVLFIANSGCAMPNWCLGHSFK